MMLIKSLIFFFFVILDIPGMYVKSFPEPDEFCFNMIMKQDFHKSMNN